jgi:hypothetical protein
LVEVAVGAGVTLVVEAVEVLVDTVIQLVEKIQVGEALQSPQ